MDQDILIIGAGAVGLTSALALVRTGRRVTVLDRGLAAQESTWAGAGVLSPLLPWDYGPEVNQLTERGRALWPAWIAEIQARSGIDPEFLPSGMLALDLTDTATARDWCARHGWAVPPVPAQLAPLVPDPARALWLPGVAQVRNPRLGQALRQACLANGVRLMEQTEVRALHTRAGHVTGIETARGTLRAGNYVIAAGAWTQALLGTTAPGVDVFPVRGQIVVFKAEPGLLPSIVFKHGHYLVPRRDGLILAGSTLEQVGFDKGTSDAARAQLIEFACAILPALRQAEIVHHWAGLRPGSPGNIPLIDRHPELGNLYVNSGHYRYGVTMAPASAEILANRMDGRPQALDVAPYAWPQACVRAEPASLL